jgi:hypothetical protein
VRFGVQRFPKLPCEIEHPSCPDLKDATPQVRTTATSGNNAKLIQHYISIMKWQDIAYLGFIGVNFILFSYLIISIFWNYYKVAQSSGGAVNCCLFAGVYTFAIACCVVAVSAALIFIRKK